jgi:hypothetical protein
MILLSRLESRTSSKIVACCSGAGAGAAGGAGAAVGAGAGAAVGASCIVVSFSEPLETSTYGIDLTLLFATWIWLMLLRITVLRRRGLSLLAMLLLHFIFNRAHRKQTPPPSSFSHGVPRLAQRSQGVSYVSPVALTCRRFLQEGSRAGAGGTTGFDEDATG